MGTSSHAALHRAAAASGAEWSRPRPGRLRRRPATLPGDPALIAFGERDSPHRWAASASRRAWATAPAGDSYVLRQSHRARAHRRAGSHQPRHGRTSARLDCDRRRRGPQCGVARAAVGRVVPVAGDAPRLRTSAVLSEKPGRGPHPAGLPGRRLRSLARRARASNVASREWMLSGFRGLADSVRRTPWIRPRGDHSATRHSHEDGDRGLQRVADGQQPTAPPRKLSRST